MKTIFRKSNRGFICAMAALLLCQLAVLLFFGSKKAGFHEDELYTYYSTNKTAGLFVNDRQWMEREQLFNDFVVLPGEEFRYHVVKQMQSWDVHPPLYYYIFHTACSLFPGLFSKWLGIGVNLLAYVGCYWLLGYVAYTAAAWQGQEAVKRGKLLAFLTCLGWGFGSAVISGVMFIRMYQWLTLFVLLCLSLHLRVMEKEDFGIRHFLLPLGVTVFLGFLTQYYYIIFHFFLGAGFCLALLRRKEWKGLALYGLFCGGGFLGAVLYYPASLSHIFRGYRGTEAVAEFGDVSNTWDRLRFFYGLFDDYMMNGTLTWWLLGICLLGVTAGYVRKRKGGAGGVNGAVVLMAFACGGYFFTVSKTALLLGETSNRYQLPVYGLFLFLVLYGAWCLLAETLLWAVKKKNQGPEGKGGSGPGARQRYGRGELLLAAALGLALLLADGLAVRAGRVFFLYEEEKDRMAFVQEHREDTVAVFYNEASPDHIWWLSDELMVYDRVFLASLGNREPIADGRIRESKRLLVYVADYEGQEESLRELLAENGQWENCRVAAEKGLWTLYEAW